MYDDLLGKPPEKKQKKPKLRTDLNAKPADPDKYPSHESARNTSKDADGHGSVSSCSDSGIGGGGVCNGDCVDCDDTGCDGEDQESAPTPKDPWADVTPGPVPKNHGPFDDDEDDAPDPFIGWEDDDCGGDCEDCTDEECKGMDLNDFFDPDEDEDAEGSWLK